MSHYADYLKETRNIETLETEVGFATYLFMGEDCYIQDIFIRPEHRRKASASSIADQIKAIAIAQGAKALIGTVNGLFKDPTTSAKALLGYGFKIHKITENVIIMKLEL